MLFHQDRAELERIVGEAVGDEAPVVTKLIRPCAAIGLNPQAAGRSRFGGTPLAPAGFEWPRTRDPVPRAPSLLQRLGRLFGAAPAGPPAERPLAFVVQIDLAELSAPVREHLCLPGEGMLAFFHDLDSGWAAGPERRRSSRLYCFTGPLAEAPFPADIDAARARLDPAPFDLAPGWMTPDEPPLDEERTDVWVEFSGDKRAEAFKVPDRFVGGWPIPTQANVFVEAGIDLNGGQWPDEGTAEYQAAQDHWRQIVQLRGGGPTGLHREAELYVMVDEGDLAAGRWDQAWVAVQYY
jgi:hypothetical protein